MTREEAKRRMKICRDFLSTNYFDMGEPNFTAFNMAISALEQEPCDDAVSRQAVLDLAKKGILVSNGNYKSVCKAINELPPVRPQEQTGHWIDADGDNAICSCCNRLNRFYGEYCKHCGAKMKEVEDGNK